MKTKNNVQEKIFKAVAIFSIFIISAITQLAGAENKSKGGADATLTIQAATDNKMEVESWMTDSGYFTLRNRAGIIEGRTLKSKLMDAASSALSPAAEPALEIENWMLDENNFSSKPVIPENSAKGKKVEMWKVQDEKYGNRKFILTQIKDRELEVENWMLDNHYW